MYKKGKIPTALKQNVWTYYIGTKYEAKCFVKWCNTIMTPFTFEAGHNIPESKGGATSLSNLRPICSSCNKSMGNRYSIDDFSKQFAKENKNIAKTKQGCSLMCCLRNTE